MSQSLATPASRFTAGPLSRVRGSQKSAQTETKIRRPRILCIDDDPEICRTLQMRLRDYETDVMVAYFGTQGFWEAITDNPDLIITDVGMPNGDGQFVVESLRNNKKTNSIPVLVLTGRREPELKGDMMAMGADRFLNKPIHFDVLLSTMREFVPLEKKGD